MTPEQKARVSIDTLLAAAGWLVCTVSRTNLRAAPPTGVKVPSSRYAQGLPAWCRPLPFLWESTGVNTDLTDGLDPEPRARSVFAFFRPELLPRSPAYLQAQANASTKQEPPARAGLAVGYFCQGLC